MTKEEKKKSIMDVIDGFGKGLQAGVDDAMGNSTKEPQPLCINAPAGPPKKETDDSLDKVILGSLEDISEQIQKVIKTMRDNM